MKISHSSLRVEATETEANEEGQRLALDIIDEVRDKAHARVVEIKRKHILFRKKKHLFIIPYDLKKDYVVKKI